MRRFTYARFSPVSDTVIRPAAVSSSSELANVKAKMALAPIRKNQIVLKWTDDGLLD